MCCIMLICRPVSHHCSKWSSDRLFSFVCFSFFFMFPKINLLFDEDYRITELHLNVLFFILKFTKAAFEAVMRDRCMMGDLCSPVLHVAVNVLTEQDNKSQEALLASLSRVSLPKST